MRIVALVSLIALVAGFILPGARDVVLLAGPCLIASLWLLLREPGQAAKPPTIPAPPARAQVIIDGSNVLHWDGGAPSLASVSLVVRALEAKGLTAGVMFDANAGYKIDDRYQDDAELARRLALPEDRVLVVLKGTPADLYILKAARAMSATVVTNDRYRDWVGDFPEVAERGFLVRGGVKNGAVWFNPRDIRAAKLGSTGP
jgi:hypothetical protein